MAGVGAYDSLAAGIRRKNAEARRSDLSKGFNLAALHMPEALNFWIYGSCIKFGSLARDDPRREREGGNSGCASHGVK